MTSIADLLAATPAEIASEIGRALPRDWEFSYDLQQGGYFAGSILDATGGEQWADAQLDERMLLFNAFGWLTTRGGTPRHPAWVRGAIPSAAQIRRDFGIPGEGAEDPADLDPGQVEAVYRTADDASD